MNSYVNEVVCLVSCCSVPLQPVVFPSAVEVVQIAHDPSGSHMLALTSTGDVYSWGQGNNGVLGHKDTK